MVGFMKLFPDLLKEAVQKALERAGLPVEPEPIVTLASDERFGDYQTNVAMTLAKSIKANPRELAQRIVAALSLDALASVELAGAGFINFRIHTSSLAERALALLSDDRLGVAKVSNPLCIVLDFSSPNVAKPMHIGHIRSTLLGDCLARVARFLGNKVITDNHVGDWGTQFGKVIYGWKTELDREALEKDAISEMVRLYRAINAAATADPAVEEACRAELVKLQQGDKENLAIWRECIALSRAEFERIYHILGVKFDYWLGESFYNERLAPLVARLEQEGIAQESEGALCVFFPKDQDLAEKPCLVRKRDGGFLYATTDLATIDFRVEEWKADAIWYVVGAPQQLHLAQVFATARRMGHTVALQHISFGSILGEDRKLMKTRSGENVALLDVLYEAKQRALAQVKERQLDASPDAVEEIAEQIGIGAVKYAELSQHRMTDYVFSWERMLALQGNTAPYLQNACVRVRSIFRKLEGEWSPPVRLELTTSEERALARRLVHYAEVLPQVLEGFRPNLLTNYLFELANLFHSFYEACPVLKAEGAVRATRLGLCQLTLRTIEHGLDLLGIKSPERM